MYTFISLRLDMADWRDTVGKVYPTYVITIRVHSISNQYEAELIIYHHSQLLPKFSSVGKRLLKRSYGSSPRIQPLA